MAKPLATIDIGSNTIHLLVGEIEKGVVLPVAEERISTGLGSGVERTGKIDPDRMRLALGTVELFARIAALHESKTPAIVATSAVRDAENGADLVGAIRVSTGLDVRLISGDTEALLGFRGAMSAAKVKGSQPVLVVDLGGGSAQVILGDAASGPKREISLPIGTNRMTERFVRRNPPTAGELSKVREFATASLPDWNLDGSTAVVAVGGSARAIGRLTGDTLTARRLDALAAEMSQQRSSALARERGLPPLRARVLPAAVTTLAAILDRYSVPSLAVARGGVREGVLLTLSEGGKI